MPEFNAVGPGHDGCYNNLLAKLFINLLLWGTDRTNAAHFMHCTLNQNQCNTSAST